MSTEGMTHIIGLTGRKRSGKDTVARVLVEEYGFVQLSFAGPLKEMARRIDPLLMETHKGEPLYLSDILEIEGGDEDRVKDGYPEYRRFLQRLGTEGLRAIEPEFWVDRLRREALQHNKVVVTDVRFPNEAEVIWRMARFELAHVWHVDASERLGASSDQHSSEVHVGNMGEDFTIYNNGTIDGLHGIVRALMGGVSGSR